MVHQEDRQEKKRKRTQRRKEAIRNYADLSAKLQSVPKNEDVLKILELIRDDADLVDKLYPIVCKKLDGTSADAKHMRDLLKICLETSKKITVNTKPFSVKPILQSIYPPGSNHLQEFCRDFSKRFVFTSLCISPVTDLCVEAPEGGEETKPSIGAQNQPKEKGPRRSRKVLDIDNTKSAKQKNFEEEEKDSTSKEVERVEKRIRNLTKNRPINFFRGVVNPKSFSGTVENIFHTSFLLKQGKIGIKAGDETEPILSTEGAEEGVENQSILSFSMADYEKWIEMYDIPDMVCEDE